MKEETSKTIRIVKANFLELLLIPFWIYKNSWDLPSLKDYLDSSRNWISFFLILFLSMFIHELILAFFFEFFSKKNWKNVKIGFIWKYLTPYAHCSGPLKLEHYRAALLMPGILLGFVPLFISLVVGNLFVDFWLYTNTRSWW
jgi:hypothetical protein